MEGKRAAVEYAFRLAGVPAKGAAFYRHHRGRMDEAAAAMGLTGPDGPGVQALINWCRDKDYRPSGTFGGDLVEWEDAAAQETALTQAVEKTAGDFGGAGRAEADGLMQLLGAENDHLSTEERLALADAVERGEPLTAQQREVAAVLLRGADSAGRAELVRELIEFVVPEMAGVVWTVRESWLVVPDGAKVEPLPMAVCIPKYPALGRTGLEVLGPDGDRTVRFFCGIRARQGQRLQIRYLEPERVFLSDATGIRLALLASWVRMGTEAEGAKIQREVAALFDGRKALVSYHAKRMAERMGTVSGRTGVTLGRRADKGGAA